jgi:hypothetical protein
MDTGAILEEQIPVWSRLEDGIRLPRASRFSLRFLSCDATVC